MRALPTYLAALLATAPAAAQGMAAIEHCSTQAYGQGECRAAAARDALETLSPGDFRMFHSAGMESFAMLSVFGALGGAVANRLDGGDCIVNDEALQFAGETWSTYVALPEGVPNAVAARFHMLDGFFSNTMFYIQEGVC